MSACMDCGGPVRHAYSKKCRPCWETRPVRRAVAERKTCDDCGVAVTRTSSGRCIPCSRKVPRPRTVLVGVCEFCNVSYPITKGARGLYCSRACSGKARTRDPVERFLDFIVVPASGECWEWSGARMARGYGRFQVDTVKAGGRKRPSGVLAHRYAYELFVGPIPDGLTIDHLCRNTACVNPAHMEPVTLAENTRRQVAAQRIIKNGACV